jgi:alpha-tubulin suppressor-like RCC1 family protein
MSSAASRPVSRGVALSWRGCVGVLAAVAVLGLGLVAVVGIASPASAAAGSTGWSQITAGGVHTCAIAEVSGAAYCWGANHDGQLGNNGAPVDSPVPVAVDAPAGVTGGWSQITAGDRHTCAIAETSGAAYCWGYNGFGQLGNNDPGVGSGVPVAVDAPAGVTGWSEITAGFLHTCAVAEVSGAAYCWGSNGAGQLGNNALGVGSGVPVAVEAPVGVTGWSQITAGDYHTCAMTAPFGAAYCWGSNGAGQLGNNDAGVGSGVPVAVEAPAGVTGWSQITAGQYHTCAIPATSGAAYCWGSNGDGQLGNNDAGVGSGVPVAVEAPAGVTGWSQITTGIFHTCAVAEVSGAAYCWGANGDGQLGNNDAVPGSGVPVAVEAPGGVTDGWSQITAGYAHTCAVAEMSGAAYCWGRNSFGQLGNNDPGVDSPVPVAVTPAGQSILFGTPPDTALSSGPVDLNGEVAATSGLPVTIVSNTPTVCTVSGTTVSLANTGTCALAASQDGDNAFAPATPVTQSFEVTQGTQTITLNGPTAMVFGETAVVTASSTSGLPVDIGVSGGCTLDGSTLTATAAGSCVVTATQAGDTNWAPATPVMQTITIDMASATVAITGDQVVYNGGPHGVVISTNPAGLPVTVTYDGSTTEPTLAGSYAVAVTVNDPDHTGTASGTLTIMPASTTLTAGGDDTVTVGDAVTVTVSVNTGSGDVPSGEVTLTGAGTPMVETLDGSGEATFTVDGLEIGSHTLTVDYPGDTNHAASTTTITVEVTPAAVSITGVPGITDPGDVIDVVATGFVPDETVTFMLNSEPVLLGTATANRFGTATAALTIPDLPGDHTITATGDTSNTVASARTTITESTEPTTPTTPTTPAVPSTPTRPTSPGPTVTTPPSPPSGGDRPPAAMAPSPTAGLAPPAGPPAVVRPTPTAGPAAVAGPVAVVGPTPTAGPGTITGPTPAAGSAAVVGPTPAAGPAAVSGPTGLPAAQANTGIPVAPTVGTGLALVVFGILAMWAAHRRRTRQTA